MSNNKQQTAVEFFYKEVWVSFHNKLSWSECERLNKIEEEAKLIEKQQRMSDFSMGIINAIQMEATKDAEKWFLETFGGNNEQQ